MKARSSVAIRRVQPRRPDGGIGDDSDRPNEKQGIHILDDVTKSTCRLVDNGELDKFLCALAVVLGKGG